MPPILDRLFEHLAIDDNHESQIQVRSHAWAFFQVLRRMEKQERNAVINLILFGCPMELPEYAHINADFLRRLTGESVATLKRLLGDIRSLGFECSLVDRTEKDIIMPGESLGESYVFYLKWVNLQDVYEEVPALSVAHQMIVSATENYCEKHGMAFLDRLDFSQLAGATASIESHDSEE